MAESRSLALADLEPLTEEERHELLRIARGSIGEALGLTAPLGPPLGFPSLLAPGAAFVSLYVNRHLRGCVGTVRREDPLHATIARVARAAAFEDPRFPALDGEEWRAMRVEISRLGELHPARPEEIVPGRHGLAVARGPHQGLFLPQVAERFGWSRERLLDETCIKAGLEPDAWRSPETSVVLFAAEVFGDADLQE